MTSARFVKRYRTPNEAATALGHYQWLSSLEAEVTFPHLLGRTAVTLEFEYIPGRPARLGDLPDLASVLGRLHHAARRRGLAKATTDSPYKTISGTVISSFAEPRRRRLHDLLQSTPPPGSPLSHDTIDAWLDEAAILPTTLYKDTNPRNVLLSADRASVLIDFDSLTLAPAGYDLAKLLVTTAMTGGKLPHLIVNEAIYSYTRELDLDVAACSSTQIVVWAEFHHLLTSPYLGRNGYQHPWPTVRPWPASDVHDAINTAGRRDGCRSEPS